MFDESILLEQRTQRKHPLCQACPAPRISSAIKTDFSHRGQISAPPHLGNVLGLAVPLGDCRAVVATTGGTGDGDLLPLAAAAAAFGAT